MSPSVMTNSAAGSAPGSPALTPNGGTEAQGPALIGLSYGTQTSCITIVKDPEAAKYETIANEDGDRMIPTCVGFMADEKLIGTQAKVQSVSNFRNTIFQFRNLLGKKLDDPETQFQMKELPFTLGAHPTLANTPAYSLPSPTDEPRYMTPQELSTIYLSYLKRVSETYSSAEGCVLSVPVHFSDKQLVALKESAQEAGFKTVYMVKEPIAAALAFHSRDGEFNKTPARLSGTHDSSHDRIVLVLDLGAHQLNSTIISIHSGVYTIIDSEDDYELGGYHFDKVLADLLKQEFHRKTKLEIDNKKSMMKLMTAAESTRRTLTRVENAPCNIESLYEGVDLHTTIHRGKFDMMATPLFQRASAVVQKTISKSQINFGDVDEVLLVGGASRMLGFQSVIRGLFDKYPGTPIRTDLEPDEAISLGCAVQAGIISTHSQASVSYSDIWDKPDMLSMAFTVGDIGIEVEGSDFIVLIKKGAPLPVRVVEKFAVGPAQKSVRIALSERVKAPEKRRPLAELTLDVTGDAPATAADAPKSGKAQKQRVVELVINLSKDHKISVVAKDLVSGTTVKTGK